MIRHSQMVTKKHVTFNVNGSQVVATISTKEVVMATVAEMPATYEVRGGTEPMAAASQPGEPVTPLMRACQQDDLEQVQSILNKHPESASQRDRRHRTALHHCADGGGGAGCAELLLASAAGAGLLDAADEDGHTAVHLAVIAGHQPLLRLLLERGADLDRRDHELHSAVHWATVCGELELLDILLEAGANPSTPDIHGAYPVHYAAQMCGPNSEMATDVRVGMAALKKLIDAGVDVTVTDQDGRQPLLWAASAETRPSKTYCASGSADALVTLVNSGASVSASDKDGLTALHCAASRGHTDCIDTLISLCGADVDVMDGNGCTPLFYAVTLGHADCTELLLKCGAEPNRQDRKGRTPAHCGAAKGQIETVKLLGRHRANLWIRNVKGDQPLHEAVQSGRKELVRWLLQQRPEAVNHPNNDGRCPLHTAAISNNIEMCKVLMDLHAHVNPIMRSSKGQLMTPLDSALYRGNQSCAKYLQLHGGAPASTLTDQGSLMKALQHGTLAEGQTSQSFVLAPDTYLHLSGDESTSVPVTQRRSGATTGPSSPLPPPPAPADVRRTTADVTRAASDVTEGGAQTDRRSTEHMGVQVEMPDHLEVPDSTSTRGRRHEPKTRHRQRHHHETEEVHIRQYRDPSDPPTDASGSHRRRHGNLKIHEESEDDVHNVEVVRRRLRREHNTRYVDERYETEDEENDEQQSRRGRSEPTPERTGERSRERAGKSRDRSRGEQSTERSREGSRERTRDGSRDRRRRRSRDRDRDWSDERPRGSRGDRRRRYDSGGSYSSGGGGHRRRRHLSEDAAWRAGPESSRRRRGERSDPRRRRRRRDADTDWEWRSDRRRRRRHHSSGPSDDDSWRGSVASERPSLLRHSRAEERWWSEAGGRHHPRRRGRRPLRARPRSDFGDSSDDPDDRTVWRSGGGRGGRRSPGPEDALDEVRTRRRTAAADDVPAGGRLSPTEERLVRMKAGALVRAGGGGADPEDGSLRMDSGIASEEFVVRQRAEEEAASVSDGPRQRPADAAAGEVRKEVITTTVQVHRTETYDQNGDGVITSETTTTKQLRNGVENGDGFHELENSGENENEGADGNEKHDSGANGDQKPTTQSKSTRIRKSSDSVATKVTSSQRRKRKGTADGSNQVNVQTNDTDVDQSLAVQDEKLSQTSNEQALSEQQLSLETADEDTKTKRASKSSLSKQSSASVERQTSEQQSKQKSAKSPNKKSVSDSPAKDRARRATAKSKEMSTIAEVSNSSANSVSLRSKNGNLNTQPHKSNSLDSNNKHESLDSRKTASFDSYTDRNSLDSFSKQDSLDSASRHDETTDNSKDAKPPRSDRRRRHQRSSTKTTGQTNGDPDDDLDVRDAGDDAGEGSSSSDRSGAVRPGRVGRSRLPVPVGTSQTVRRTGRGRRKPHELEAFQLAGKVGALERDLSQLTRPQQDRASAELIPWPGRATGNPLRFQAEKRIFQDLLELKRVQMRVVKTSEEAFVKRLSDNFNLGVIRLGLVRYTGPMTYRDYEQYLNDQVRRLQSPSRPSRRLRRADDLARIQRSQRHSGVGGGTADALHCHQSTYRCHHAAHAYTGVPCAAYTPTDRLVALHSTAVKPGTQSAQKSPSRTHLPRIESAAARGGGQDGGSSVGPLRLELDGGGQRRTVELPTAPLDGQRRYQVSFKVRPAADIPGSSGGGGEGRLRHRSAEEQARPESPHTAENGGGEPHTHALSL